MGTSKTQIRGPHKVGSGVADEGALTLAVVNSYAGVTEDEARARGQAVAAAVLPLRRALWALAERYIPERLAAALRARCDPGDPTGRDGVRELRMAIADWLDPPPICRWCRRPIRPDNATSPRPCPAASARRARPARAAVVATHVTLADDGACALAEEVVRPSRRAWSPRRAPTCRPSRTRRAAGAVDRCGTLALYPAGSVDLATMAAALACPRGAASGYDVAADRDCRALLAATCPASELPHPVDAPEQWSDEAVWRLYAAVAAADQSTGHRPAGLPRPLLAARAALQRARNEHQRINGRIAVGIQRRYHSPRDGVTRADLLQGAAIGNDRGVLDYDATQARYTTYGANWARQGCGEVWAGRDLVGCPPWLLELRRAVDARLRDFGGVLPHATDRDRSPTGADLLCAIEAVVEAAARRDAVSRRLARALADDLVALIGIDAAYGSADLDDDAAAALLRLGDDALAEALPAYLSPKALAASHRPLRRSRLGTRPRPPYLAGRQRPAEDPERARERLAAWCVARLVALDPERCPSALRRASGPGLLAALRHGAPVIVQIGSGADDDDDDVQGAADGAGGTERRPEILVAPDDTEALAEEADDRVRWSALLAGLATLQATGATEAAEIVRRHHGLDSVAEDGQGAGGESFASIGATGLRTTGRVLTKEAVRKIYLRAIDALRAIVRGAAPDLTMLVDEENTAAERAEAIDVQEDAWTPRAAGGAVTRSVWKPIPAPHVVSSSPASRPVTTRPVVDAVAWDRFMEEVASVVW